MRIVPPSVEDAEALADLHLGVWEEAYADLMPASVFADRRSRRDERVSSWRAIRFYERQGFGFDGATKPEDVGLERRMVRG